MPPTESEIQTALQETQHAGGENYTQSQGKLDPATADTTVSTLSQLQNALDSTADVIEIDSNIYVGTAELDIGTKTLVGDRGWNGSNGPLLYTDAEGNTTGGVGDGRPYSMFYSTATGGTPRLSGLRIRGSRYNTTFTNWTDADVLATAITARGDSLEVDNCDIWGWTWTSIMLQGYSPSDRVTRGSIHHNQLRQSYLIGYGYGVNMWYGAADISHTYFNSQCHSVAGFGWYISDFDVNECVFGPTQRRATVDMHCLEENTSNTSGDDPSATDYGLRAGGDLTVRNSTFAFDTTDQGNDINAIGIRGVPWHSIVNHHNRFTHPQAPPENSGNTQAGYAWRQPNVHGVSGDYNTYDPVVSDGEFTSEWNSYENQFDADNTAWSQDYGASVNLTGETTAPRADLAVNVHDLSGVDIEGADVEVRRID